MEIRLQEMRLNLFDRLHEFGSSICLIDDTGTSLTYEEIAQRADDIGSCLDGRCLAVVVCANTIECITGYIGLVRAGAAVLLVQDSIRAAHFADLLARFRPRYAYAPAGFASLDDECAACRDVGDYRLWRTRYHSDYDLHPELAVLLTTSGSTGTPAFVRQSYENVESNARSIAESLGIKSDDRPITTMPMSYTYGLSILHSHLLKGASIVVTEASLVSPGFWKVLKASDATTFGGVPFIYQMLKRLKFADMDLPKLRYITQAGGKLSMELTEEFAEVCEAKGIDFFVMYGQTEATARMSVLPAEFARKKAGSVGKAIPRGEFWLVDENGNTISGSDREGYLMYRGPNVMLGYAEGWNDLSKGDENGGILDTGDIARRDGDGFYTIVGRRKRFLKVFGHRINLDDVERVINDAGFECACAGDDDDLKIFAANGCDVGELKKAVSELTTISSHGFRIIRIDEIPRNDSGKVLYSVLNEGKFG